MKSCSDVILISDCATLKTKLTYPKRGAYYELTSDLYCEGVITEPLPPFTATLDGRNFAIVGLSINVRSCSTPMGLFSRLESGAVVKNLFFLDSTVQGSSGAAFSAGTLAGEAFCRKETCTVFNVHVGSSRVVTSNTVQTYGRAAGGVVGLAFGLEIVNCTVRDTVVVNLDNHAGVAAVRRSARSGRSSSRESRKGQEGRNPARVSVNSEQSSVAGGVVGAAVESFLAGCHNFGFTQNPLSPIVTTSNYKSYQKSGVDYAGGVAGLLFKSNITRSGTTRGTISSSFFQGGVVGIFVGGGPDDLYDNLGDYFNGLKSLTSTHVFADQLYALDQVFMSGNIYTTKISEAGQGKCIGGIIGVVLNVYCNASSVRGECPFPTFSNLMSKANIYINSYAGGLFGEIRFSNFTVLNSFYYFSPANMELGYYVTRSRSEKLPASFADFSKSKKRGKKERRGWKLAFDENSDKRNGGVLYSTPLSYTDFLYGVTASYTESYVYVDNFFSNLCFFQGQISSREIGSENKQRSLTTSNSGLIKPIGGSDFVSDAFAFPKKAVFRCSKFSFFSTARLSFLQWKSTLTTICGWEILFTLCHS